MSESKPSNPHRSIHLLFQVGYRCRMVVRCDGREAPLSFIEDPVRPVPEIALSAPATHSWDVEILRQFAGDPNSLVKADASREIEKAVSLFKRGFREDGAQRERLVQAIGAVVRSVLNYEGSFRTIEPVTPETMEPEP
jgi:hypothetical protein